MKLKNAVNLRLRRLLSLCIILVLTITLFSCRGTYNRFPTGNLAVNAEYAKIGDTILTVGELWEEFRYSTDEQFKKEFERILIQTYVEKIKTVLSSTDANDAATKEKYLEKLAKYASKGIYGTEEKGAKEVSFSERLKQAKTYIANLYLNNSTYIASLYNEQGIYNAHAEIDPNTIANMNFEDVYVYFYEDLAKYLFAYDKLEKNIVEHDEDLDDDEDPYFSRSEIRNHFKTNFENTGDIKLIMIRFMNESEVNDTLKSFGIKVFKNSWYYVPGDDKTWLQYNKYYDDLEIKSTPSDKNEYLPLSAYDEAIVAELFLEIYNYIYTYRNPLPTIANITHDDTTDRRNTTNNILTKYYTGDNPSLEQIISNLGNNEYVNFTSDQIDEINASLYTYVYETLIVPGDTSDPDKTSYYSTTGRSYGNFYYLVYKLDVAEDEYTDVFSTDDDGEEYIDEELHPELIAKIIAELKENELTDSFISNSITEAQKDMKVQIYDTILEIAYSLENPDYSKTHKKAPNSNTLAKISYDGQDYFFTIDTVYKELETTVGSSTAVDLLTKKIIKNTEFYKNINQEDSNTYKTNLDYTLAMFSNDQLTSYGFPASMGKYNFMLMYYRTTNVNEIINNFYKVNAAMSHYIYNYENEALLKEFVYFTQKAVDNNLSINASNLLVYVDMDEDGNPDKDFDWLDLKDDAQALINNIMTYVKSYNKNHLDALQEIIDDYNSSSRFTNGLCTPQTTVDGKIEYDPTRPDCKWAGFRKLGLYIKIEAYEAITSTSNVTEINADLKARLFEIYNNVPGDFVYSDDLLSYPYIDNPAEIIKTEFGFNQLVVTSAHLADKFTFDEENDLAKYFTNIPIMFNDNTIIVENLLSDGDAVSINQIKVFIYENQAYGTTNLLPSEITSALTTFFQPVLARYTAAATQRELLLRYIQSEHASVTFTGENGNINAERFVRVRSYSQQLEDKFLDEDDIANNFAGWWEKIFVPGGNK